MTGRTFWTSTASIAALTVTALIGAPAAHADSPALGVVASGFAGPLHVAFGPGNSLYVADAFAGAITKLDLRSGGSRVIASDLGFSPGIDVQGNGNVMVSTSAAGGPGPQTPTHLLRVDAAGDTSTKADMLAYELANNPDGQSLQAPDAQSNPYSVLALPGRTYVADAAANDIIEILADGSMRTVVVFPNITTGACANRQNNDPQHPGCDPVPTDLEMGADGFLYVSGLGGEVEGHIYKVDPSTGDITQTWGGFPPLTGIALGDDGSLYAASLFTNTVFRISSGGVTSAFVPAPTDVEWGHGELLAGSLSGNIFSVPAGAFI